MIGDVTRLLTMSIADLLDDWFESPQVKGALAVNGVIGTWAGPYEPGTAYVMAHHSIGDVGDGQLGSWGYPEGGMGGVSEAIARSARSFGAEIRTNARVSRVLMRGGQVQRRGARQRRRDPRLRWWSPRCTRRSPSSTTFRATNCPTTSSATSSTGRPAAAS